MERTFLQTSCTGSTLNPQKLKAKLGDVQGFSHFHETLKSIWSSAEYEPHKIHTHPYKELLQMHIQET